ncbi:hypothetical protein R6Q59_015377 [Mikania micrantha]|uniref:MBD domain-containing protein n=1 Tax=Mikania micrantha TaxID=192012 RepID=A0A5N6PFR5_9ASTR|nr:hypothetical protein E3N88_08239 [Mikania micrantha]
MGPDNWPDWLPFDWTVNIRKINQRTTKCYVHPDGHKCYSKPEVLEYVNKTNKTTTNEKTNGSPTDLPADPTVPSPTKLTPRTSRRKSQSRSRDLSENALAGVESSSEPLSSQRENGDSSWLPEGWTVETKVRKGGGSSGVRYKCYMDPISGQKFFSKPQVLNHLAKTNNSAGGQKEQKKSTTEPDNPQTREAIEVKKSGTRKKRESVRMSSDYDVISRTPAEGLPTGWMKEIRVRKHGIAKKKDPYYLDPLSEYVFFSKKDALRYLDSGDVRKCVMKPIIRDVNNYDTRNVILTSPDLSKGTETPKELPNGAVEEMKTNESGTQNPKPVRSITGGLFSVPNEENSDWLPDGWVIELHYRNSGMKFKVFREVATGKKLYSKPQVLNYLSGGSSSNSVKRKENKSSAVLESSPNPTPADVTRPKRSIKKKGKIQNSDFQEVITTSAADGLPPGWIKEIRTKIYATHKRNDPFYTDPVSGYIFRSKMDAMRYLDTGDVNLCAIRPKVKDKDGNEVFVYTNDVQKPVKPATGKRHFEDKEDDLSTENHEAGDLKTTDNTNPKVPVRSTKQNNPAASSPGRSSKRKRGLGPGTDPTSAGPTGGGQVKQAAWVNLEKQPDDDGNLSYDIPEDDNWTDQCIDFAVKTLANEIMYNGGETTGVSETPTKVN